MSPLFPSPNLPDAVARRARAKERLYVIGQTGSWLLMLSLQVFFAVALTPRKAHARGELVTGIALLSMIVALGWLISHFARPLVHRWGWKELGWRMLIPRIALISSVQSAIWCGLGYTYPYLILRLPLPPGAVLPVWIGVSWIQGVIVFTGWWCLYFFYHLFDRYSRLATAVKEAELRALKSQVNPHFIFNSLNSLRALIDEDPARARQAVTQLASLLRYSLQSAQAETVPFEEELRVVNDYLALEQVRHEERLRLKFDIAPETLSLAVPPLLLQTLVENAVKYGISPRPDGGEIEISARCVDGQLRLRVTNPGELALPASSHGSTGVGLKNAAERLRLSFGDRARLQVRAEAPALVVAEVCVPGQLART